uniref:Torque teno mini virus ORF2-like protein n=1 Tax=uncultured virus TaxID=340016 RepID=S4TZZ2_9VIRU|nr:Torque teno mini virus ORF2-like protein [uncultured virus]
MSNSKLSKKDNLQLVNCYVSIHDLKCNCDHPLECILQQINTQEPTLNITYKKCRTGTETGDHHGGKDEEKPFGEEELEAIFEKDATEGDG